MTKRDFFILVIKLFGLSSLVSILFTLPGLVSFSFMEPDLKSLLWTATLILAAFALFILLVFYADKVVSMLKLDKGFDDDRIELGNLNARDIVKIATFIIGGLLIIQNIPVFIDNAHLAFKSTVSNIINDDRSKYYLIISGIKIAIGYLLIRNYNLVAKLLGATDK